MTRSLLVVLALGLAAAPSAAASDLGTVKCGPNQDRVWVYESLNSFDVETRLKCNEPVEILGRVKGYVKIRTASGVEGYVPDAAFPDLPALPDDADKPIASLAARAAASTPGHSIATMPPPPVTTPVESSPAPAAPAKISSVTPAPPSPALTSAPAKPATMVVAASPAHATAAANPRMASTSTAHSAANIKTASAVATPAKAKTHDKPATPTVIAEPPAPKKTPSKPAPSNAQTAKSTLTVTQPAVNAAMVLPARATPSSAAMMDTAADTSSKADVSENARDYDPDLEEYPDEKPLNESADPACRIFFSAYGLNPAQYKWMVENRKKQYASICPASDLAHVDFVILLAHDSDTFNSALPVPVHTDRNGFSDFSPMTTVDTALQSVSELDKARYEFVWVFHTRRGTFDPSKFTARRRPLFTTDAKGSHAAARAVDDAFQFIEGQGSPDR